MHLSSSSHHGEAIANSSKPLGKNLVLLLQIVPTSLLVLPIALGLAAHFANQQVFMATLHSNISTRRGNTITVIVVSMEISRSLSRTTWWFINHA